ncbi:MAG: hypothetical protein GXP33_14955 [Spirochaetes bacterium]|nr:hypothetical protein [Spirochaetota bacterium]
MKLNKVLLFGLSIIIAVGLVFVLIKVSKTIFGTTVTAGTSEDQETAKNSMNNPGFKLIHSGSMDSGDVLIELTPEEIKNGKLVVKFSMNTHSVNLSRFDLKSIATLEYEEKILVPIDADGLRGHHSSGVLVFDVGRKINSFTIKIKGIPKNTERTFTWNAG